MSIPKEPRQQMINMMYLFLTAMLALNVSAEILRAFRIVNDSLEVTTGTIISKNTLMYEQFKKKLEDDREKTKPFYDKAQEVKSLTQKLASYIKKLKDMIIDAGGNQNKKVDDGDYDIRKGERRLKGEGDLSVSSWTFIDYKGGIRGKKLKKMINDTRTSLINLFDEKDRENLNLSLYEAKDPEGTGGQQKTWQQANFGEVPLAAAVTLLSKYETDVRNTEADLLNYLLERISATDYKFDKTTVVVNAKTDFVLSGSNYEAEIMLAAYSSTSNPEIIINAYIDSVTNKMVFDPKDTQMVTVVNGKGYMKLAVSGIGPKSYTGVMKIKNPDGSCCKYLEFKKEYTVSQGGAVVSPTKMNVLYIGLDNPLAISAAGFTNDRIRASVTGGSLRRGRKGGEWIAKVRKVGKSTVTVMAVMEDGTSKKVGAQVFRTRRVPDPIAEIAGKPGGRIPTHIFKAQKGIIAQLHNFEFDVRFRIGTYEMIFMPRRKDALVATGRGERFTNQMISFIRSAKPGDKFSFMEIRAKGPDGTKRKLPSIMFDLQ